MVINLVCPLEAQNLILSVGLLSSVGSRKSRIKVLKCSFLDHLINEVKKVKNPAGEGLHLKG